MKKLLFFFLLLILSCESERRYCYDCDLYTYNTTLQSFDEKSTEYCDKTEDEIVDIIRQHNVPHLEWMDCTKREK
jgi:hypothetical protein